MNIPYLIFFALLGSVATVSLVSGSSPSDVVGRLVLSQASPSSPVLIRGRITGLSPGLHGFHIHQVGDTADGCRAAGGHFNPFELTHGAPDVQARHVGDLGNIEADANGHAVVEGFDHQVRNSPTNSAPIFCCC